MDAKYRLFVWFRPILSVTLIFNAKTVQHSHREESKKKKIEERNIKQIMIQLNEIQKKNKKYEKNWNCGIFTHFMWSNLTNGAHIIHFFVNYILIAPNLAFKPKMKSRKKKTLNWKNEHEVIIKTLTAKLDEPLVSMEGNRNIRLLSIDRISPKKKNYNITVKKKWYKSRWSARTYHYPIRYRVRFLLFINMEVMAYTLHSHKNYYWCFRRRLKENGKK